MIGVKKKLDRREAVRERKALSAAQLERSIEKELIERLKSKAYGDAPLNVNETVWQAILDREKNGDTVRRHAEEGDLEMIDDETDEEEEEELEGEMDEEWGDREFVSDVSGDEDDGLSDLEDIAVRSSCCRVILNLKNAQDDGSVEDDDQSDEEPGDIDGENVQPTTTLGKRKPPLPSTHARKRQEKKPRSERHYPILFSDIDSLSQKVHEWKWSTSRKWRVCHSHDPHWRTGNNTSLSDHPRHGIYCMGLIMMVWAKITLGCMVKMSER